MTKDGRKKQARTNKQELRQSNTAQSLIPKKNESVGLKPTTRHMYIVHCTCTCTVEDKKTFPFDVLQNGTVCIVVRCVLRNGIKTLQKRYALKTVVERLKNGCGTVKKRLWNGCTTVVEQFTRALRSWVWLHALVELAERSRCKYKITGTIVRTPGSGRPSKITAEVKALVERQMRHDDETTAAQLHVLLVRSGFAMDFKNSITVPNISGLR